MGMGNTWKPGLVHHENLIGWIHDTSWSLGWLWVKMGRRKRIVSYWKMESMELDLGTSWLAEIKAEQKTGASLQRPAKVWRVQLQCHHSGWVLWSRALSAFSLPGSANLGLIGGSINFPYNGQSISININQYHPHFWSLTGFNMFQHVSTKGMSGMSSMSITWQVKCAAPFAGTPSRAVCAPGNSSEGRPGGPSSPPEDGFDQCWPLGNAMKNQRMVSWLISRSCFWHCRTAIWRPCGTGNLGHVPTVLGRGISFRRHPTVQANHFFKCMLNVHQNSQTEYCIILLVLIISTIGCCCLFHFVPVLPLCSTLPAVSSPARAVLIRIPFRWATSAWAKSSPAPKDSLEASDETQISHPMDGMGWYMLI